MAKPYRVCVARKGKDGKTYWTGIGAAFKRDNGGMSVVLDALPIGNEMMIFPPDEEGSRRGGGQPQSDTNGDGDDVPY